MTPMRVGLIGTGVISDIYLETLAAHEAAAVVACASLDPDESRAKAAKHGIARVDTPEALIADPEIDTILNLTIPAAHAPISTAAVSAGKHVYAEKPIVTSMDQGHALLAAAEQNGVLVGNAPDTFLGGRWQTCRKLIDQGVIGKPTGVMAHVGTHGVERHHPNPDFYYQPGGGPLLDLGPYYLTAMISLLGPLSRVAGLSRRTFDKRMIESQPRHGEWMPVSVDTHVTGLLEFHSGVIGTITASFDTWDSETPRLEIYGTDGTLSIPDPDPVHGPNLFEGPVLYRTRETSRWTYVPRRTGLDDWQVAENTHGYNANSRGLGLIDLAYAARDGRAPRASGAMALHVFEAMTGILEAGRNGHYHELTTTCAMPAPLPETFPASEG